MDEYPDKLKLLGDPTRFKILQFLAAPVESYCTRDDGVFRALGDPTRVRLLSLIAAQPEREACVCDLTGPVDLSQPTVSHHMKQLVDAGLVTGERRGRWVYYELVPEALRELATTLEGFAAAAEARSELAPA